MEEATNQNHFIHSINQRNKIISFLFLISWSEIDFASRDKEKYYNSNS